MGLFSVWTHRIRGSDGGLAGDAANLVTALHTKDLTGRAVDETMQPVVNAVTIALEQTPTSLPMEPLMKRLLGILLVMGVMGCGSESKNDASTPENYASTPGNYASTPGKTPSAADVKRHMTAEQLALGDPLVNSIGMVLVPIPAGEFMMGDSSKHPVKITKPFHMGAFEVTQDQYEGVMGNNNSIAFKGPNNPIEMVRWKDAVEFCRRLSELPEEKAAGHVYRLPTEAEWEYACRAGTTTKYSFGDDESQLGQYAWSGNSGNTTHPVGQKKPNPWGLYDTHGNVWELCQDWLGPLPSEPVTDPTGPTTGSYRVFRGGGWDYVAGGCRSGYRPRYDVFPRGGDRGFRVARGPAPEVSLVGADDKPAADLERQFRTWTSTVGTEVEARLAGRLGDTVKLGLRDGTELKVPYDQLSEVDQKYIEAEMRK